MLLAIVYRLRLWILVLVALAALLYAGIRDERGAAIVEYASDKVLNFRPSKQPSEPIYAGEDFPLKPPHESDDPVPEAGDPDLSKPFYESTSSTIAPGSREVLAHPDDYLVLDRDDDWCEELYGPEYLHDAAARHTEYCEPDSASKLECFRAHYVDEFCFAQGVQHTITNPVAPEFNCKLRNFTHEKLESPAKASELEFVKDIQDFNNYFFGTGAGQQLKEWTIAPKDDKSCTADNNDGKFYLIARREGNVNLWHKLMELWQAMISVDAMQMAINPRTGKPFVPAGVVPSITVVTEDQEVGPVWDLWGLISGNEPIRRVNLPSGCLGNVILPLAGSSSPFWQAHWEAKDCKNQFMLRAFLRRIYRHLDIQPKQRFEEETVITIIDRKRTRKIINLPKYVERLQLRYPEVKIQAIDFAKLSLKDQILTMRGTDVLVGVIGAGMTHLMFLPKESSVAEIIPPGTSYAGFRNLAKMRRLGYFTTHGQSEEEWNATLANAASGKLRDLAFGNEEDAAAFKEPSFEDELIDDAVKRAVEKRRGASRSEKRDWQGSDIFITNAEFQALIDAAIQGQGNRGLRIMDVTAKPVSGKDLAKAKVAGGQ